MYLITDAFCFTLMLLNIRNHFGRHVTQYDQLVLNITEFIHRGSVYDPQLFKPFTRLYA